MGLGVESKNFYQGEFMDLSPYRLEPMSPGPEWDRMVEASPQGTLFSLSPYLAALDAKPGLWCCIKNETPKAILAVIESDDGRHCVEHLLVIYGGLMFLPHDAKQNGAQIAGEEFRISSFVTQELTRRYQSLFLPMSPFVRDLRPFLWHNYDVDGSKFVPDLRYTSFLDLRSLAQEGDWRAGTTYQAAGKSRRQESRYAKKKGVTTRTEGDVGAFTEFYRMTFARQEKTVSEEFLRELAGLVEQLTAKGLAKLYVARTADGEAGSMAVFGVDGKRAYYLYNANDPGHRANHTGSAVLWDAFVDLAADGIPEVDLEGINSPLRGHFKISFGGTITPYFHLKLEP
jgi:hypothetical protein